MKKLAIILSFTLLLVSLGGCQFAGLTPAETTGTTEAAIEKEPLNIELPLTKQTAIQVALHHAGLDREIVKHLHAWLDQDGGPDHYDVDFRHGEYYYAYEISQATGEILKLETEHERTALPETQIPKEDAAKIALDHEEFTEADVKSLTVEFDSEDHRYEIVFVRDGVRYIYEVCAETGKILDIDKEIVH